MLGTTPPATITISQVTTLRGEAGGTPVLITADGALMVGEGITVAATHLSAKDHLRPGRSARYEFTIGLNQREPITFLVNVLGEPFAGACRPQAQASSRR
jgi:hypothetical protein